MNRKQVNDMIKMLVPGSSKFIGAPRRRTSMPVYLSNRSHKGNFTFVNDEDFFAPIEIPALFAADCRSISHVNFIAWLKDARVWGANGAVISADDYLLEDVSREFNKGLDIEHSVFYTIRQVPARPVKGKVAVIGTSGANIYYHWMIDILPRFALLQQIKATSEIDYFITGYTGLRFQEETLKLAGIPLKKIMPSNDNWKFHVQAEELYVPSLAGPLDQPTPFQVNFLRKLFRESIRPQNPGRRIYISRKKVNRRAIVNEVELLACLAPYNFEVVHCEDMSVADQARLFSEASIIIGSHGSAFTNLVFCNPGTKVIDIFNEAHLNPCFWFIANIGKISYQPILGRSFAIDENPKNHQTIVDIEDFESALKSIGIANQLT